MAEETPKLLIVDDKPENLYALARLLARLDVQVVQANSGFEALEQVLEHDFCVAIVDIQMPEMDGYELVEMLRSNKKTARLPVIFVSAIYSDEYHHRKGYDAGAVDFLSKPFVPDILLSKVRVFIDLCNQRRELQTLIGQLDQANAALSKRAAQLEASNQIGHQITSILDLDPLLTSVVGSIRARFGHYFVGVWLPNPAGDGLTLQAGAGQGGGQPLPPGFEIRLDATSSILASVFQNRRAYLADDVGADARYLAVEALSDTGSELALPLQVGQEMIGVLDIQSDRPAAFDRQDRMVLDTLASQVAIAIHNARLYADMEKQVEVRTAELRQEIRERRRAEKERERFATQLSTAADVSGQVNAILDPQLLLNQVVLLIQERFDLFAVRVYTLDPVGEAWILAADGGQSEKPPSPHQHRIPRDQASSLVARTARSGEPILVDDVGQGSEEPLAEVRARIIVPLVAGDEVIGVLDAQADQPNHFSPKDVDVYRTLAGQIATALQNARLFERVQQTAERLRELDRAKGEFLAVISHELKTPLNAILGYTQMMLLGVNGELSQEMQQDLESIQISGDHLTRLIDDILDLTAIEAGQVTLALETINLAAVLANFQDRRGQYLAAKPHIAFEVEAVGDDLWVETDLFRLDQVLHNLLSNAIKFTEQGHVRIQAYRRDNWGCVAVEDTGVGIAEEDREQIFERFRQVDGSEARQAGGLGLGLAITRPLVGLLGGKLEVESELDRGSTFTVCLPACPAPIQDD